jgi:Skp family chaperone for outer membrane proteins
MQFQKKKDADTAVKSMAKGFEDKLQLRGANKYLNETEIAELETLKTKASPTDKDKARITELQDLDKKRNDELQEIQGKPNPTEADRSRLRELQTTRKKSEDMIVQLTKEYRAALQKESADRGKALQTEIVDTIQKVSQQKGMALVVDKQAVLFGGTDITKTIIDALNKK